MSKPDQQIVITKKQMNAAGLKIKGLEDLLLNLEAVFKFCSKDAVPKVIQNTEYKNEDFLGYALIKF
jgi:hypothetical protein